MSTCSHVDCGDPVHARGLCSRHESRLRRTGTTELPCFNCAHYVCDRHQPLVCVCDAPVAGSVTGECACCYRPYWFANPELQAYMGFLRTAWRQFLSDEGVLDLYMNEPPRGPRELGIDPWSTPTTDPHEKAKQDIAELDELIHLYVLLKASIQMSETAVDLSTAQQDEDRRDLSLALASIAQKGYDLTLAAMAAKDG